MSYHHLRRIHSPRGIANMANKTMTTIERDFDFTASLIRALRLYCRIALGGAILGFVAIEIWRLMAYFGPRLVPGDKALQLSAALFFAVAGYVAIQAFRKPSGRTRSDQAKLNLTTALLCTPALYMILHITTKYFPGLSSGHLTLGFLDRANLTTTLLVAATFLTALSVRARLDGRPLNGLPRIRS